MRPNTSTGLKHSGTLAGNKIRMTIDEESTDVLMKRLTDLYSDKEEASIREPASNAWDSHIAAGNPDPIEVWLPTELDPTYKVVDHGTGLDFDQMVRYYGKYGASTKRDSDEFVGMMGLGCKAPLTMTSQFTVHSYKDGVHTVWHIARGEDGVGSIEPVEELPHKGENGVVVEIPISSNIEAFNDKAKRFFSFWEEGTVLVNGAPPERPEGEWLDPSVFMATNTANATRTLRDHMIVMGNVPYPIPGSLIDTGFFKPNTRFVFHVGIGDVDPTPPRESLDLTENTLETIRLASDWIKEFSGLKMQAEVEACSTPIEALEKVHELNAYFGHKHRREFTYRGATVPTSFYLDGSIWRQRSTEHGIGRMTGTSTLPPGRTLPVGNFFPYSDDGKKFLFIHSVPVQRITGIHAAKVEKWLQQRGATNKVREIFYTESPPFGSPWLDDKLMFVSYDEIKDIKVPRPKAQPHTSSRTPIGQMLNGYYDKNIFEGELPEAKQYVYFFKTDLYDYRDRWHQRYQLLESLMPDGWVVLSIRKNYEAKFRREHGAISIQEALPEIVRMTEERMTPMRTMILGYRREYIRSEFYHIKTPSLIEDKRLRALLCALREVRDPVDLGNLRTACINYDVKPPKSHDNMAPRPPWTLDQFLAKYPLLRAADEFGVDSDHLIEYINVLHRHREATR